jgi:hypothetical protein
MKLVFPGMTAASISWGNLSAGITALHALASGKLIVIFDLSDAIMRHLLNDSLSTQTELADSASGD